MLSPTETILKNVDILSQHSTEEYKYIPRHDKPLPSIERTAEIVELIKSIIFPGFFGDSIANQKTLKYHIGMNTERLYSLLTEQIYNGICFSSQYAVGKDIKSKASELALIFIDKIPEIKRLLCTDVKATFDRDPSAKSYAEVIFSYPTIKALINHRVAHELLLLGVPTIPRIISELAHSETGIDIHPAAKIGEYFSIDHGTGVVIGETCIIGNHVRLYQGVTLGAKSILADKAHAKDIPRHPILEDNVTIYSNSTVLGRIVIGHNTVIGGNVWLTTPLPPYSNILQQKAVEGLFTDGLGI